MNPITVTESPEAFQYAVNLLAKRPAFLAHVFFTAFAGDVSAPRIAEALSCSEVNALRLAMMTVPRPERQHFSDDVSRVASAAEVDREKLLAVIKQAQVLSAFDAQASEGMLLAARDVLPDSENQGDDPAP